MADNGVVCSMSRSGNVWDNAASPIRIRYKTADVQRDFEERGPDYSTGRPH